MCIRDRTVPMIKTGKDTENKSIENVTLPAVGTVHVKAPTLVEAVTGQRTSANLKLLHAEITGQRKTRLSRSFLH